MSKDRKARFGRIAAFLNEHRFDVVALQEVWTSGDWHALRAACAEAYPHSVRWSAGLLGSSGLALLSRHEIVRSRFVPFSAAGPIDRIWQGDWFACKGVGMATLVLSGSALVDVYTTHLHSQYGQRVKYTAVRAVQADEVASALCASVGRRPTLLLGDLNGTDDELPYQILRARLPVLVDVGAPVADGTAASEVGGGLSADTYPSAFYHRSDAPGRLDYVLAAGLCADGVAVVERGLALSDHCAVHAVFTLAGSAGSVDADAAPDAQTLRPLLEDGVRRAMRHKHRVTVWQRFWDVLAVLCLVGFIGMTIVAAVTITNDQLTTLLILLLFALQPVLTITMVIAAAFGRIFYQMERVALREAVRRWSLEIAHMSLGTSSPATSVTVVVK